jgi:hypothetical protein
LLSGAPTERLIDRNLRASVAIKIAAVARASYVAFRDGRVLAAVMRRHSPNYHDVLVAEGFEVLCNPLTLGRGLQQNTHRRPPQKRLVKRSRVVTMRRSNTSPLSVTIRT